MAVIKIVNKTGKYTDDKARGALTDYITRKAKTPHHQIGGSHVDMRDPAADMKRVAEEFHKDHGIRLKHVVISFGQDDGMSPGLAAMAAEDISERVGLIFQNVYAVHEDKGEPHIHMVLNAVNRINGYKFSMRDDQPRLTETIRECLEDYGVEDIRVKRQ